MSAVSFFASADRESQEPPLGASVADDNSTEGHQMPQPVVGSITTADVGHDLRNPLTDGELEAHIRDLGRLSEQAYAQGDPTGARLWSARMVQAIAQRSPAKQAEMTAAIDRRIDELTFDGVWAQELGKRLA